MHGRQTLQVQGAGNIQVKSILQDKGWPLRRKTWDQAYGRVVAVRVKVTVTADCIDGSALRGDRA